MDNHELGKVERRSSRQPVSRQPISLAAKAAYEEHDRLFKDNDPSLIENYRLLLHHVDVADLGLKVLDFMGYGDYEKSIMYTVLIWHDRSKTLKPFLMYREKRDFTDEDIRVMIWHARVAARLLSRHESKVREEDRPMIRAAVRIIENFHHPWLILDSEERLLAIVAWMCDLVIGFMEKRHRTSGYPQYVAVDKAISKALEEMNCREFSVMTRDFAKVVEVFSKHFSKHAHPEDSHEITVNNPTE